MIKSIRSFMVEDSGATAIEYGLIAALVALVGVVAFTALGESISSTFAEMADTLCTSANGTYTAATADADATCVFT